MSLRFVLPRVATAALTLAILPVTNAAAIGVHVARYDGGEMPHGMDVDCVLQAFDACSGWIWVYDDVEGAVWGVILSPQDCRGGCASGGELQEIYLYSICATSPVRFGGVGVSAVDAVGCRTALLWESGPTTIVNCTPANRWTTITTPCTPLNGNPFAVTVTWGAQVGGVSQPEFALDSAQANLYCRSYPSIFGVYPGCATSTPSCSGWTLPPTRSFIWISDINGDGSLDDLCALYGQPYALAWNFLYAYIAQNMLVGAGLGCTGASATEPSSWGRVKALFQ